MKTAPQEWLVAAFLWPEQQDMKSLCHNGLFLLFLLSSQGAEIIPTCISNMLLEKREGSFVSLLHITTAGAFTLPFARWA